MTVSVVVPTYNRSSQIGSLLKALEDQTYHDFETILVNDGSTDGTLDVIEELSARTTLKLMVYSIINRGRAGARNFGIEKANGDLIIFFDDDTRPNREAIWNHVHCHARFPKVLVSGPHFYDSSKFIDEFNFFRQWMELKWVIKSDLVVHSANVRINGANFSMKKEHLMLVGGFDERLKDKEDFKLSFDFKYRFKGDVIYSYGTWVFHDDFRNLSAYIERERSSRIEEQKLAQIDPQIGALFPERFAVKLPGGIKYQAGRIFRVKALIKFLDRVLNTRLLFRSLRYKIYDIIITMNVRYF